MQNNRDVIDHYLEEQEGQFVTPRIKHLFSNAIQSSFGCCRNTPRPSYFLPWYQQNVLWNKILRGSLRHSIYLKDFNAKNRDLIGHYLEQRGPVCNTQSHEKDAMCNTSLSFLQKNASSNFGRASRE